MRFAKWLLIGIVSVGALVMVGAFLLTQFIDPERFKPEIIAAVKDATGRQLQWRGPLQLSWFPMLALETSDGSLAGGVGEAPLVSWRRAKFGAGLLPLLGGNLQLDRIQLEGLTLNLQRDAAGVGNWETLLQHLNAPGGGGGPSLREIAGISLRDATLNYRSADGSLLQLTKWRLDTGRIAAAAMVDIDTAFELRAAGDAPLWPVTLKARVKLQGDALDLETISASLASQAGVRPAMNLTLRSDALHGDFTKQTGLMPEAVVSAGAANLRLRSLQLQWGDGGPQAAAQFMLPVTSLRQLLSSLGMQAPRTRDPAALERFAAAGTFEYSPKGARVSFASLQLDNTRLTGTVGALGGDGTIEFALTGDAMNLDRYRSPLNEPSEPFVFPTARLAALRARGTVSVQRAQVADMELRGVTLRLLLADGRVQDVPR